MENKLWIVLMVLSTMTSLTSQGVFDISSLMTGGKEKTTTTTPTPEYNQQEYNNNNNYNQQQYGQQYNPQGQKPNKDFGKPTLPQKPGFPGFNADKLKQDFNLNKFELNKFELDKLKPDKLELKPDKLKQDKMHNNYSSNNYQHTNYSNMVNLAAPIENPVYSSYVPQLSPPVPIFDDGSYIQQTAYYGPPPQQYGPQYGPQYGQGQHGQYRAHQQHGQGHNYGNNNLTAYNYYRQMYGYDNPTKAPKHGHPSRPAHGQAQGYGNARPQNVYNEHHPPQNGHQPTYGVSHPPPSYENAPVYGVGQAYDQGYHDEPSYGHHQSYNPAPIDFSKYVSPMPYSEVSEYISPSQYNEYTGTLYQAYNIPAPTARPYTSNYTKPKYSHEFQITVAVVVLDGRLGVPQSTNVQGTIFISEIYPYVCLVSGVVTGLPPNYKYGIAIHTYGDITNGCASLGPHYNPGHKNHGNINYVQSHAGDLGNLQSDGNGVAFINKISKNQFSIQNRNPVAGRAIGICEKQDDLGLGGNVQSLRDGNCGGIQACGIIGYSNTGAPNSNSGHY